MKARLQSGRRAFTLLEVLVVIAILAILAALLIPMRYTGDKSRSMGCMNNPRQVVMAELIWSGTHGDKFSAQISTNAGGSMEWLAAGQLNLYYKNLGPLLSSPDLLRCPTDERPPASGFWGLTNGNISYFASLDAQPRKTSLFFAGDRNLALNGSNAQSGVLTLTASSVPGWTKEMHNRTGRLGFVAFPDGHTEGLANAALPAALSKFGSDTNRLVFP
jgi:prepilin-type N-terminal cleavage/methylation domain-containing protein